MSDEKQYSMDTPELRERLNRLYLLVRNVSTPERRRHFELLWDLKELALMERRLSVEVPESWLEDLEQFARNEERKGA